MSRPRRSNSLAISSGISFFLTSKIGPSTWAARFPPTRASANCSPLAITACFVPSGKTSWDILTAVLYLSVPSILIILSVSFIGSAANASVGNIAKADDTTKLNAIIKKTIRFFISYPSFSFCTFVRSKLLILANIMVS